ncbi:MAG: hypothetical protein ACI9R3_002128 [Verrucomicrobiales bacterium]|jgi:hypothetical protein
MNLDDNRFVLAAFRPDTEDADDPRFRDALQKLQSDAELKSWFDEQNALSSALRDKLREIHIPAELRSNILTGAKVSAATEKRKPGKWPRILALAACIAILGASVFLWSNRFVPSGPVTFAAYHQDMRSYLNGFFLLDYESEDLENVQNWLATKYGYSDYKVPDALASFPSLGCEVIDWHGKQAFLICFDVDGELVHLFSMPGGKTLTGAPSNQSPSAVVQTGEWSSTSWIENDRLYLVATLGNAEHLKRSLGV